MSNTPGSVAHKASPTPADLALVRELDIIGDRERGIVALFPVSRSEWRLGVRQGRYPKPLKSSPGGKMTFWRRAEILAMLAAFSQGGSARGTAAHAVKPSREKRQSVAA